MVRSKLKLKLNWYIFNVYLLFVNWLQAGPNLGICKPKDLIRPNLGTWKPKDLTGPNLGICKPKDLVGPNLGSCKPD